jgi:glycine/D-amino acid oxidase-like deaminating enzyme
MTDCEVTDVTVTDGAVSAIETTQGRLTCDNLVVAAGPWTPKLADSLGVTIPITPTREQVIILELPESFQETYRKDPPTSSLPATDWYLRPDGNARLLIATHALTDAVDPDDYDRSPDQDTILELADALRNYIPALSDAEISGQYCGVYSTTPDRDFILDTAGPEGCYFACGFSGHGFKHGPGIGRIMTDFVTDGHTELVDTTPFSFDRFEE